MFACSVSSMNRCLAFASVFNCFADEHCQIKLAFYLQFIVAQIFASQFSPDYLSSLSKMYLLSEQSDFWSFAVYLQWPNYLHVYLIISYYMTVSSVASDYPLIRSVTHYRIFSSILLSVPSRHPDFSSILFHGCRPGIYSSSVLFASGDALAYVAYVNQWIFQFSTCPPPN